MKLRRLRLLWRRKLFSWSVEEGHGAAAKRLHLAGLKSEALAWAIAEAKREPTSLLIQTKDGRFQEERTYPRSADSRRRRG